MSRPGFAFIQPAAKQSTVMSCSMTGEVGWGRGRTALLWFRADRRGEWTVGTDGGWGISVVDAVTAEARQECRASLRKRMAPMYEAKGMGDFCRVAWGLGYLRPLRDSD